MPPTGHLFVISAPSGAGKTSLVRAVLSARPALVLSVSYTTRTPRPQEIDGRDYHFVSAARFQELAAQGAFLEHAQVFDNWYGTGRDQVARRLQAGEHVLLEIDWQGAQQVRKLIPDAIGIFILPPSLDVLRQRMKDRRQDSAAVIERRLKAARGEIAHLEEFDYVIINNIFDDAVEDLASIVRSARLRLPSQIARHSDLINSLK